MCTKKVTYANELGTWPEVKALCTYTRENFYSFHSVYRENIK